MEQIEEYELFGAQWKKEVCKLPKMRIIEMAATLGKERDKLQMAFPTEIHATYDTKDGEILCAFVDKEQCEKEAIESGCGMQTFRLIK